ncbi:FtsX-like permease family protein [Chlorobaculum sp. MV4-Y]|uniref:ABC transporter permease n=1 Tax=Chlorobaculum sp. MV4-Y TaxID=2976335 RepID=UPI0021B02EFB|nr:FtsX-like permease family protein [Chlorobaculum sp. MV4-Y]UWX58560.1 FtsX-like permease family protein [Chlorobaculum sp. MV4-Y]
MKAGIWIARRYSFARKRFRVINIISGISLAGIVVGVSTLLVVMSVLNGFQKLARDLFVAVEGPVQIVPAQGRSLVVSDSLLAAIAQLDGVETAQPFAEGQTIITASGKSELIMVRGLTAEAQRSLMKKTLTTQPYFSKDGISAGNLLAERLRLYPDEPVRLFSPELISAGLQALWQPELMPALSMSDARVQSSFSLQKLFDDRYVLAPVEMAQNILLFGRERYSGIDIRGKAGVSDETLEARLREWISATHQEKTLRVLTLGERHRDMFAVMQLEKWASFAVLMLVILVALLSLAGSLAMTVIDKRHELFYLRCLGLERPQFMTIFIVEGGLTGLVGTALGSLLAWLICKAQELWGIVQLPSKSAFIISAYPVSMKAGDFFAVGAAAILFALLVSLYPAGKAAAIATSRSVENKME